MRQRKISAQMTAILGIGCAAIVCVCIIGLGGILYVEQGNLMGFPQMNAQSNASAPEPVQELPTDISQIIPTVIPLEITPTPNVITGLTGSQSLGDYALFDDFSSKALGWKEHDDGMSLIRYEDEAYSIQIMEPDWVDWSYIPASFTSEEIQFDARVPDGSQEGTFGVFCQYQDVKNHYFVEFDLSDSSYFISSYKEGIEYPLTAQNSEGQYWQYTDAFQSQTAAIHHIYFVCYPNLIMLYINDQWVNEISVPDPLDFNDPGRMAFFAWSFSEIDENGYKVIFDNVEVWEPVQ